MSLRLWRRAVSTALRSGFLRRSCMVCGSIGRMVCCFIFGIGICSGSDGRLLFELIEKSLDVMELGGGGGGSIDELAEFGAAGLALAVPGNVLARHQHAHVFAVKLVEPLKVVNEDAADFAERRRRQHFVVSEVMVNDAEQPGRALRGAAYHHRVGAGALEHVFGFLRRGDVAVGDHGYRDAGLDRGEGVVLGVTAVTAGAGAAMHRQRLYAALLGDARDRNAVAVVGVPAGADFCGSGTSSAGTTASSMRATSASSCNSAEPAITLHTFLAGQPILMSMIWAP